METIMTDHALYPPAFGSRLGQSIVRLGRSLCRLVMVRRTFHALDELPDYLLKDIGLTRGDIDFVAKAVADASTDTTAGVADKGDQ
jgi:uncharacterized protein YjiS (DUF1127 family)